MISQLQPRTSLPRVKLLPQPWRLFVQAARSRLGEEICANVLPSK